MPGIARALRKYAFLRARMLPHPAWKLAPGPFSPLSDGALPHPRFLLETSQRYGPIFKFSWDRNLSTGIVGFELGREFLTENQCRISGISQDLSPLGDVTHVRNLSGDIHRNCKRHLVRALPKSAVDKQECELRAYLVRELGAFANGCSAHPPTPEDLKQLTRVLATGMLVATLFGVHTGSNEFEELVDLYLRLGPEGFVWTIGSDQVEGYREIERVLSEWVGRMSDGDVSRAESEFLKEFADAIGEDRLVLINLLTMIEMGRYDLSSFLRWIVSLLSANRNVVGQLLEQRAKSADDYHQLAHAIVLESLRHVQSESLARRADEDIVFNGHFIPRRSFVRICLWETHKDPTTFPDPFRFDPGRFLTSDYDANSFSPFGLGEHKCVAADAAVRLATMFVEELAGGFEWQATGNGAPVRPFSIWEPAPEFTISLEKRTASGA